jgi:hypothetical protein
MRVRVPTRCEPHSRTDRSRRKRPPVSAEPLYVCNLDLAEVSMCAASLFRLASYSDNEAMPLVVQRYTALSLS